MKKYVKVLMSSLSLVIAPMAITSCNCHKNYYTDINVDINDEELSFPALMSSPFTANVGEQYRFNIDISNSSGYSKTTKAFSFAFWVEEKIRSTVHFKVLEVKVDSRIINFDPTQEKEPELPDTYIITYPDVRTDIPIIYTYCAETLSPNSKISIILEMTKSEYTTRDIYAYFFNTL